jgi:hypothetical protein
MKAGESIPELTERIFSNHVAPCDVVRFEKGSECQYHSLWDVPFKSRKENLCDVDVVQYEYLSR